MDDKNTTDAVKNNPKLDKLLADFAYLNRNDEEGSQLVQELQKNFSTDSSDQLMDSSKKAAVHPRIYNSAVSRMEDESIRRNMKEVPIPHGAEELAKEIYTFHSRGILTIQGEEVKVQKDSRGRTMQLLTVYSLTCLLSLVGIVYAASALFLNVGIPNFLLILFAMLSAAFGSIAAFKLINLLRMKNRILRACKNNPEDAAIMLREAKISAAVNLKKN